MRSYRTSTKNYPKIRRKLRNCKERKITVIIVTRNRNVSALIKYGFYIKHVRLHLIKTSNRDISGLIMGVKARTDGRDQRAIVRRSQSINAIYTYQCKIRSFTYYLIYRTRERRRNVGKRFSVSRELALPSGSLAMTVLLRSTPPFLSSVQHTHIHHVYTDNATVYHYITPNIRLYDISIKPRRIR